MLYRTLLYLLFMCFAGGARGQPGPALTGVLVDSTGSAVYGATVCAWAGRDTACALSSQNGRFSLTVPPGSTFTLIITMKGFRPYRRRFTAQPGAVPAVGTIMLLANYEGLEPVTVSQVRPVTMREDTVSYHASAYPLRAGSVAEDLLKRLPSIEVDAEGNVIVQGKKIGRVMVDGKDFFSGDVLSATRNLPAGIIDRVEVIDDYGDKARLTGIKSGEAAKVLNIVLKPDKREGAFGEAQAGAGNLGKYQYSAMANRFSGERQLSTNGWLANNNPTGPDYTWNLGVHYADRWAKGLSGYGSLNLNGDDRSVSSATTEDDYNGASRTHLTDMAENKSTNKVAGFNYTVLYKPDAYRTFRLIPSLTVQLPSQRGTSSTVTDLEDSGFSKRTTGQASNIGDGKTVAAGIDLYTEHRSRISRSRWSVEAAARYNGQRQSTNNLTNTLVETDGATSQAAVDYVMRNQVAGWQGLGDIRYFAPLGPAAFAEAGYRLVAVSSTTVRQTLQGDSAHPIPVEIDSLSSRFTTGFTLHRLHAGLSGRWEKLNITAGLDAQPGELYGSAAGKYLAVRYHFFNLLPMVESNLQLSTRSRLGLNIGGNPVLPTAQQLQPSADVTNPQSRVVGNPRLKTGYTQTGALRYEYTVQRATQYAGFGVSAGYSRTSGAIIANILHPRDNSQAVQVTTYENAGGFYNWHGEYHATLPAILGKHLKITFQGSYGLDHSTTLTDSVQGSASAFTWAQNAHLALNIPGVTEADVTGSYSHTSSRFAGGGAAPAATSSSVASWMLRNKHYFFRQWILAYSFTQLFTGSAGSRLQGAPPLVSTSIQYQFLKGNAGTLSLSGYNLASGSRGVAQSVTPTSTVTTVTDYSGRYFMASFSLRLQHFRAGNLKE